MKAVDVLDTLDRRTAIDAAYYAVRLIKHGVGLREYDPQDPDKDLVTEPSPEARAMGADVIRCIEQTEESSISNLSEERVAHYIATLEELVRRRFNENLPKVEQNHVKRLLDDLRKTDIR